MATNKDQGGLFQGQEIKPLAETKIQVEGNVVNDTAALRVSATPIVVPTGRDKQKIPEKVNLNHLMKNGKSPFHNDGTLDMINMVNDVYNQSKQSDMHVSKIRKAKGKNFSKLTTLERTLNLEFSVIFARDLQNENQFVPITLYRGNPESILGQGGFGKVKIGYDEKNKQWVAVKVQEIDEKNVEERKNAKEEIHRASEAGGRELGRAYLERKQEGKGKIKTYHVMSILGKSLSSCLQDAKANQKDPLNVNSVSKRFDIAIQMVKQIKAAHEKGFIHRDIKPDNFLYDSGTGNVTLVDWGIGYFIGKEAKKDTEFTAQRNPGTIRYVAPEIYDKRYSKSVDTFALGVTFQDMFGLHQKMPINPGQGGKLNNIPGYEKLPPELEKEMMAIINPMISANPKDRSELSEVINKLEALRNKHEQELKKQNAVKPAAPLKPLSQTAIKEKRISDIYINKMLNDTKNKLYFNPSNFETSYNRLRELSNSSKTFLFFSKGKKKNPARKIQIENITNALQRAYDNPSEASIKALYEVLETVRNDIRDKERNFFTSDLMAQCNVMMKQLEKIPEFDSFLKEKPRVGPKPK